MHTGLDYPCVPVCALTRVSLCMPKVVSVNLYRFTIHDWDWSVYVAIYLFILRQGLCSPGWPQTTDDPLPQPPKC